VSQILLTRRRRATHPDYALADLHVNGTRRSRRGARDRVAGIRSEQHGTWKGEHTLSHVQEAGSSNEGGYVQRRQATAPGRKSAYVLGIASGVAVALFAPLLRPAARKAVKGFIHIGRHTKKVASHVKEELEDITAEVQAEMDR
jgi:hypothetical protein